MLNMKYTTYVCFDVENNGWDMVVVFRLATHCVLRVNEVESAKATAITRLWFECQ